MLVEIWGIMIGAILATYFASFYVFVIGKCMGFQFHYLRFMFWEIKKKEGKLTVSTGKWVPICHLSQRKPNITKEEDMIYSLVPNVVGISVSVGICAVALLLVPRSWGNGYHFVRGMCFSILVYHICLAVLVMKEYLVKKERLSAFTVSKVQELIDGGTLENIELPDMDTLKNLKAYPLDKMTYLSLCYMQCVWTRQYEKLEKIVRELEINISPACLREEMQAYYNILFYHMCINPDIKKAKQFFNRIKKELLKDDDANGRRVLAYYQYYVLGEKNEAEKTALDGLSKVSQFSICDAERNYEKRLMEELLETIKNTV